MSWEPSFLGKLLCLIYTLLYTMKYVNDGNFMRCAGLKEREKGVCGLFAGGEQPADPLLSQV